MNSAYHHVEDGRKTALLLNMRSHLKNEGCILVGEHFLPSYQDERRVSTTLRQFVFII